MKEKKILTVNKVTISNDADRISINIGKMSSPTDSNIEEYIEIETINGVVWVYANGSIYVRLSNTNKIVCLRNAV